MLHAKISCQIPAITPTGVKRVHHPRNQLQIMIGKVLLKKYMLLGYIANIRPKIKKIGGRCFAKITINIPFEEEKKIHYPVHELLITPLSDLRKELVKKASQEGCYINASLEPAHTTNFQPGDSVRIEARIEGIWVN